MICPDCKGAGTTVANHVSYADGRHGYNVPLRCSRCKGEGTVPEAMADWIARGKAMREKRLAANRNLLEEAQRRGLGIAELSKMEFGKIEPVEAKP
jgi:hypothetical protein